MNRLEEELAAFGEVVATSFQHHTTFHVGGDIPYFVHLASMEQTKQCVEFLEKRDIPYKILGKGSNLLPSDEPFDGVVLSLEKHCSKITIDGTTLYAEAGASLIATSYLAMQAGLSGLEFASGIPGTIGGAIFMNAGAYKSDMAAVVKEVCILKNHEVKWVDVSWMKFAYRYSILKEEPAIVLAVKMELQPGEKETIEQLMQDRKERRLASQPYSSKSAGSTFKNPEGHEAWRLIDSLHLRGTRIGGAVVSEKHCNFIINDQDASAQDVKDLMNQVQQLVFEKYQVELHLEVELFNWKTTSTK